MRLIAYTVYKFDSVVKLRILGLSNFLLTKYRYLFNGLKKE